MCMCIAVSLSMRKRGSSRSSYIVKRTSADKPSFAVVSVLVEAFQVAVAAGLHPVPPGIVVAPAPEGGRLQSGAYTHATLCMTVKAIGTVLVEVNAAGEELVVVGEEVVDEEVVADELVTDVLVVEVNDSVLEVTVLEAAVDVLYAGALEAMLLAMAPTAEPTHAFQFVISLVQVVEMSLPVCCKTVLPLRTIAIETAPVLPLKATLP